MSPSRLLAITVCGASLCIALLDCALAMAADRAGNSSAIDLATPMALLTALAATALSIPAFVVGRWVAPKEVPASALALASGAILFFGHLWIADLNRISAWREAPGSAAFRGGLASVGALLAAIGVARLVRALRFGQGAVLRVLTGLVVLLAFVTCVELSAGAEIRGQVNGWRSGLGLGVVGFTILLGLAWSRIPWLERGLLVAFSAIIGMPLLVALGSGSPRSQGATASPPSIPRIVLVTVDTLRRDALTCYARSGAGTPNIDRLASEGLRFTAAYSSGPWTIPAFVSLMTGMPVHVHGVAQDFAAIPERYATLAERLREAGYRTAAIGNHPQLLRMGRGFDDFDFTPRCLPYHSLMTGAKLLWPLQDESYTTDDLPRVAGAWLERARREPFFLWLHFLDPHGPYESPVRFLPPDPLIERFGASSAGVRIDSVRAGRQIKEPTERAWLKMLYRAEVRWVDEAVGRLLDHLRRLALYDDALVILLSDHGEEFWEHGHSLYDELVRVPLIVKLPGPSRRGVVDSPVSTASIVATVLDLGGRPPPEDPLMAVSFADLLREERVGGPAPPIFLSGVEYFEPREGVVVNGQKYIRSLVSGSEELYDLVEDGAEIASLVASQPDRAAPFRRLLESRTRTQTSPTPPSFDSPGVEESQIDKNLESNLRALGYVE